MLITALPEPGCRSRRLFQPGLNPGSCSGLLRSRRIRVPSYLYFLVFLFSSFNNPYRVTG